MWRSGALALPQFGLQQDGREEACRGRVGLIVGGGAIPQQRQAQRRPQLVTELHIDHPFQTSIHKLYLADPNKVNG